MVAAKANLVRLATQGVAPPNLVGIWKNEINSIMTIIAVNGTAFAA